MMKLLEGSKKFFLATDLFGPEGKFYYLLKNSKFLQNVRSFSDFYTVEILKEKYYIRTEEELKKFFELTGRSYIGDFSSYKKRIYGDLYLIDKATEEKIDEVLNYQINIKNSLVKKFQIATEEINEDSPIFKKDVLIYFLNIEHLINK